MEAFAIEQAITAEEREAMKQQTLDVLKRKYLQYKAEYISMTAVGNTKRAEEMMKLMDECDKSYRAVEEGL